MNKTTAKKVTIEISISGEEKIVAATATALVAALTQLAPPRAQTRAAETLTEQLRKVGRPGARS